LSSYVPTNWQDYPSLATAINAARLNNMESGISAAYHVGSGGLTNADIAANAAIAYSKLALTGQIVNADIAAAAAIAYSKLQLAAAILNSDIAVAAAIDLHKLNIPNDATKVALGDGTWGPPPASGTPAGLTKIAETTLATPTASIDFTSIPQTYRQLRVVLTARSSASGAANLSMAVNGDSTSANYNMQYVEGSGPTAYVGNNAWLFIGTACDAASPANWFAEFDVTIPDYRSTAARYRDYTCVWHGATGATPTTGVWATWWQNTAAITRLTFTLAVGNFVAGSYAALYGIT
jgi:hypothetical protein